MKILAVGAHPDDAEIYMFGTLLAAKARGDSIAIGIATDGSKGGAGDPAILAGTRKAEAQAAAAIFDAEPRFLGFPDGALTADAQLVGALKLLITEVRPHLILTHAPNDYHGDHRALSEAVRIAASFSAPVLWADTMMGVGFAPTHYVDITAPFAEKARAILAHSSQDPERFVSMVERWNGFRGAQANSTGYAEAFRFEPSYPFVDIRDLLPPAPLVRGVKDRAIAQDASSINRD